MNNGTYKSIGSEFILLPVGEVVQRTWKVEDENMLTFEVSDAKGLAFRFDLSVTSNDCDQVILEVNTSQITFIRLN